MSLDLLPEADAETDNAASPAKITETGPAALATSPTSSLHQQQSLLASSANSTPVPSPTHLGPRSHAFFPVQLGDSHAAQLQQSLALQQIQQQYPNGVPLDVIALAQAIQIMQLSRGASNGATQPAAAGYSGNGSSEPLTPYSLTSPASSNAGPSMMSGAILIPPPIGLMHPSHSTPQLAEAALQLLSPSSARDTHSGSASSASGSHMTRATSSVNLGARGQTAPAKATFPLTRW